MKGKELHNNALMRGPIEATITKLGCWMVDRLVSMVVGHNKGMGITMKLKWMKHKGYGLRMDTKRYSLL